MKYNSGRLLPVDLLRFFLACIICILHFDWHLIPQGYLAVEIFFILAGFFFAKKNFMSLHQKSFVSYLIKRFKVLYIWYLIAIACFLLFITDKFSLSVILNALLLWPQIGLAPSLGEGTGAWWFLGVYIYIYILYLGIFCSLKKNFSILITGLIVFSGISILYHNSPAYNINITNEFFIFGFSFGMIRGLVGFGLGILIGHINIRIPQKQAIAISVIFALLLTYIMSHQVTAKYDFLIYPIGCVGVIHIASINVVKNISFIRDLPLILYLFHQEMILILPVNIVYFFHSHIIFYIVYILVFAVAILLVSRLTKKLIFIFLKVHK